MAVIYTGLFLGEDERERFLSLFPPKHANIFADHVTLCFKPEMSAVEEMMSLRGKVCPVQVLWTAEDDKGQAALVEVYGYGATAKRTNRLLHITISCADGVSAAYSNKLLESTYEEKSKDFNLMIKCSRVFMADLGLCRHEDADSLPEKMWARRGLPKKAAALVAPLAAYAVDGVK